MAPNPSGPSPGALSLYANLLDPNSTPAPGTISSAPVLYKQPGSGSPSQDDEAAKKQVNAAVKAAAQQAGQQPAIKSTLADWTAEDEDINGFYAGEKRQRGGRKKRKKNKEEPVVVQDWDDIYDPSRPNNYLDYKNSDEYFREIREWKDRLYAHRTARQTSSDFSSDTEDRGRMRMKTQFAPPPNYSFAPPTNLEPVPSPPPANIEPASIPDDPTGEDAYARRMRLSQQQQQPLPPPPPSSELPLPIPPTTILAPPPPTQAPPPTISREPVRYTLPAAAPAELPAIDAELESAVKQEPAPKQDAQEEEEAPSEEPAPRSNRPGQAGFAQRLMAKYGWTKGSGLGASGSGIITPLAVKADKRKKLSDAQGGGFKDKGGKGKIIGGKKAKTAEDEGGKFGAMSEVIVLSGMVDGLDLGAEMQGDLMQEIGEECGDKYGRVERVFIHRDSEAESVPVFVKFTSQLSALRAVNALEGRIFNGNTIRAKFFDTERFENGIYE
ncbi:hypothetical protein H2199_004826 [Coniosporium tulheliwenetii]|uniref:Uncharacterized protein n=1 Tax=Coniosporium tulheliwenetii TaxID=3383036 RepID=A0ACC2Z4H7_9PEZI|nr:hypothetical protein H2199_004826 [Cladosporium sp. JES 115]